MFRRIGFLIASVALSWGIVYAAKVSIRLARHGEPLLRRSFDASASRVDPVDPSTAAILPSPPAPRVGPTQSIFGPSSASLNPAPPTVNLHARDLSATPLPSAPLIAGNATDSLKIAKEKNPQE